MNKKLFLGMFAAAGMLLATSCSNDELDAVQSGNEAQVTFNLGTEGAIATRAISDGLSAKKLVCAVYDANKTLLDKVVINNKEPNEYGQFVTTEAFQGGRTDQIKVTLAKGQEYTMVFWAQHKDCDAYNTNDLTAVTVDYTNGADGEAATGDINNDDTRDAFFAAETFKVEGNKEINVTLKRPFAQINVGVTAEDWEAAFVSGIEIEKSAVVIKNAATSINLLTGEVSGSTEVNYALNAIPNDPAILKVDADGDGEDEDYNWLSMSYILVADATTTDANNTGVLGDERTTLEGLQYTFTPNSGSPIEFKEGLAGAPVQRNWRTNILGKILTGDIQFNITIDNKFEDDYIYPDGTAEQELEFAATFGGTFNMNKDIDLTGEYLEAKADFILNMNNNKLTVGKDESSYGFVVSNGTTTINDANIVTTGAGIKVSGGADIVFNSGEVQVNANTNSGSRYVFYTHGEGTTTIINGGSFSFTNKTRRMVYICADQNAIVYVKGGEFGEPSTHAKKPAPIYTANGGQVIITGGTFGFDPSKWVANGYSVIKDGAKYIVVEGTWAEGTKAIVSSNLSSVEQGGVFVVAEDIEVTKDNIIQAIGSTSDITIHGNGKTINSVANSADDFNWDETGRISTLSTILSSAKGSNATVTVNDLNFTGEMQAISLGHYVDASSNWYNTVLNNVNVIDTKVVSFSAGISPAVAIYGTAKLNNCNIKGTTLSPYDTDPKWPVYDLATVNYSDVTINGGEMGSIYMWNQATVTVTEQAKVGTIVIRGNMNASKYGLTIKAGATVNTIDLSAITNKEKVNITIEESATVSSIVANGTTYESIEDFKNAQ